MSEELKRYAVNMREHEERIINTNKVYLDILLSGATNAIIESRIDLASGKKTINETMGKVQGAITNLNDFMRLFHNEIVS